jgi:hypothetical protein
MFRAGGGPGEQPLPLKASITDQAPAPAAAPQVLLADISEFQPEVTDQLYAAWSKAIVIRAAYGAAHDDKAWYGGQRRDQLHSYGIRFLGIYQYVVAGQDPVRQAGVLGSLIGTLRPGEKIIGDFEEGAGDQAHRRDLWAARISQLGAAPWIYSGLNFAAAHGLAPADWVAAYQGAEPAPAHKLWQFTDAFQVPGVGTADCSVYHGTIGQLAALAWQGAQPEPAQTIQEDDMPVYSGEIGPGAKTGVPVVQGTVSRLALYADFTSTTAPLTVRVAVLSAAKAYSQITTVQLGDSRPHYVLFTETDVAAVSFQREDADPARDVGYFITG